MTVPHYQVLPDLSEDEFGALKADIASRGVLVPIEVDEDGRILDGHHRARAIGELRAEGHDVAEPPTVVRTGLDEDAKVAHALVLNLARRHLDRDQRTALVVDLRSRGWSYRRIADVAGAGLATIYEAASGVRIRTPETVTGADGKSYPSRMAPGSVPDFEPVPAGEQPRLDQRRKIACPECGHEFHLPR